jgi:hypothetical protein
MTATISAMMAATAEVKTYGVMIYVMLAHLPPV